MSASPIVAKAQYLKRHSTACAQLHFNMCKENGVKLDNKQRYDHVTKLVETSHEGKVRQTHYGTNRCKLTQPSLTVNRHHNP
jgi:hypothetical protein